MKKWKISFRAKSRPPKFTNFDDQFDSHLVSFAEAPSVKLCSNFPNEMPQHRKSSMASARGKHINWNRLRSEALIAKQSRPIRSAIRSSHQWLTSALENACQRYRDGPYQGLPRSNQFPRRARERESSNRIDQSPRTHSVSRVFIGLPACGSIERADRNSTNFGSCLIKLLFPSAARACEPEILLTWLGTLGPRVQAGSIGSSF